MTAPPFSADLDPSAGAATRLRLSGSLRLDDGDRLVDAVRDAVARGVRSVDFAGVETLDGACAALLETERKRAAMAGKELRFEAVSADAQRLLDLYECPGPQPCLRPAPHAEGLFAQIGEAAIEEARTLWQVLAFFGDLATACLGALRRPGSVHFGDLPMLMERAGANGLPIVLVVNFLIGAILGVEGAIQLHRFGADPFLASLVGLSVVRELGPLMTAILVAGRSGAAYAAELGTMKVGEEIDALHTMGLDPQRFLVLPRVLALAIVVPMLTVFADIVGCLGGMVVGMTKLELSPQMYANMLQTWVGFSDVATGLIKSVAYAVLIGLVACQRGMAAHGGARGVGSSTTSAVVVVLFGLVVLDALFTVVFNALGW